MAFKKSYIPYKGYWSTPFAKWQGSFANMHSLKFAGEITKRALAEKNISSENFTNLYLGMTVPTPSQFYNAPWLAGMIGAENITGALFSQACATSARVIGSASHAVECSNGNAANILCITADRTSNGPHLLYPNPTAPGGKGKSEDWVWDNFNYDPLGKNTMLDTAENVAKEMDITTEEQHEVVLIRHSQYQDALKDNHAFQKEYIISPIEINPSGRKVIGTVEGDEGIFPTTSDRLAKLRPVMPNGTVTFGGQTFPADGNAGMVVTTKENADELSADPSIQIKILAFSEGRTQQGFMPKANAPAVRSVLKQGGVPLEEIKAIKTHNPFAVNDIFLSREFGIPIEKMNNFGSSLIWGHPQAPTGMRLIIELIEELVYLGGGYGLFTGCAAGDTAAAILLEVSN